jgi:hypothetical protein
LRDKALSTKPLGRGASLFVNAADVFYPRRAGPAKLGAGPFSVSRTGRTAGKASDDEEGAAAA